MTSLTIVPAETSGTIHHVVDDVTGRCPHDEEWRDVYEVTIEYRPDENAVEIASLGAYLRSFGDTFITHEALTEAIFRDLRDALDPAELRVVVSPNDYHGVSTEVRREL